MSALTLKQQQAPAGEGGPSGRGRAFPAEEEAGQARPGGRRAWPLKAAAGAQSGLRGGGGERGEE